MNVSARANDHLSAQGPAKEGRLPQSIRQSLKTLALCSWCPAWPITQDAFRKA